MAVVSKGIFSLNLGILTLGGELSDEDRQCAWELYTEITTRIAVSGKGSGMSCKNFDGEVLVESLDSLYTFFKEARGIMRRFPVGKIEKTNKQHLGILINRMLTDVIRPFLEKWQAKYRYWWENESNPRKPPMERQLEFPSIDEFLADWTAIRELMREVEQVLVATYHLQDVGVALRKSGHTR